MTTMSTDGLIDILTDGEGDSVTFVCKNPDFNGLPNECVIINASWTDWKDRSFRADTREECLQMAIEAMNASMQKKKPDAGGASGSV